MSLERALELAERGRGTTHPNPVVGCVLLRGDKVVGEAWHEVTGGPHAEVLALREAGDRARGATAYVTMEPCAHHGRTPPCADALIEAGVVAVLAGCLDPHPDHAHLSRRPAPVRARRPGVPAGLDALTVELLSLAPAGRTTTPVVRGFTRRCVPGR